MAARSRGFGFAGKTPPQLWSAKA